MIVYDVRNNGKLRKCHMNELYQPSVDQLSFVPKDKIPFADDLVRLLPGTTFSDGPLTRGEFSEGEF